jgi:hypothetical protein
MYEAAAAIYHVADLTTPVALFRVPRQSQLIATRIVAHGDSEFRIVSGSIQDPAMTRARLVVRSQRWGTTEPFLRKPDGELVEGDYGAGVVVAMTSCDLGWAGAGAISIPSISCQERAVPSRRIRTTT